VTKVHITGKKSRCRFGKWK